jgi:hypothetical protein
MTVVIVIELFRSTKQALWKKFLLFVQNIVSSQTRLSSSLHRAQRIGMIGATITLARKLGSQHILHIRDGESDNDKAMVSLFIFSFVLYFRMCMYLG